MDVIRRSELPSRTSLLLLLVAGGGPNRAIRQ